MQHFARSLVLLFLLNAVAFAADYSGKYSNPQVTLELVKSAGAYSGSLTISGKTYPVTAKENATALAGKFDVNGTAFDFSATLDVTTLKLNSGGREHVLTKQAAGPQNPLDLPPTPAVTPSQPVANGPSSTQVVAKLKSLPAGPAAPNREWTVLVHLNADNDLEKFGIQDLNEMEKGLSGTSVEVLVLIDRCDGFDTSEGDWQGARLYRVKSDVNPGRVASELLLDLGEINMGDPDVLAAFVEAGLKAYPARQTALIMWNHGGGWASMSNDFNAPGKDRGDDIKLTELRGALETALPAAGVKKLSILGFDMCLMAQIETATELAGVAEVMVASEAIEPVYGWPYDFVIPAFGKDTAGARRVGTDIVTAFNNFYKTVKKEKVSTLSAMDLSLAGELNTKLNALLSKLQPAMPKAWPVLARSIFYGEQYCSRNDYQKGPQALATFDLLDIMKRLKHAAPDLNADAEYRDFMAAADRFVMLSANSERHHLSNGLAVYAPVNAELTNFDYIKLKFAQESTWPAIVGAMHTQQKKETEPPVFSNIRLTDTEDKPIPAVKPLAGHRYQLTLTGKNIIYTQAWTGRRVPGVDGLVLDTKSFVMDAEWITRYEEAKQTAHLVDLLMPKYQDGVSNLKDDIPGIGLVLSNGQDTATCTIDASDLSATDSWQVQALLQHPDLGKDPVMGAIIFSNNFFDAIQVVAVMPQPDGSTRLRAVEPSAELKVSPLHEVVSDKGEFRLHAFKTLTWNKGLNFVVQAMEPREYEAILIAETMSGVSASTRASFRVEADPDLERANQTWQYFKPEMLVGTWEAGVRFPNEIKPLWKLKIAATDQPNVYKADIDSVNDGQKSQMLILLDRRGLPHIRMIEIQEDGTPGGAIIGPALFDMTPEGNPVLVVKLVNLSGVNTVWKRQERAELPNIQPQNNPNQGWPAPQQPMPQPNPQQPGWGW